MNALKYYFFLILFAFFSCDTEKIEPELNINSPQIRSVDANEIPDVIDQISQSVKRFNSNPYSANNEGIDLSNLSYTEILEVIDTLDNKNYTFRLDDEDDNPFTFTNLLVKKRVDGDFDEPKVISYSLDQAHINSFLRSGMSMRAFIGTVETIYLNQYKQSKREYKANLENVRSNTGSPCPPQEETFTYSNSDALNGDNSTSDLGPTSTTTQMSSGSVEVCITYFEPDGTGLECTPEVHELLKAVSPADYEENHKDGKCKPGEGDYVRKTRCQIVNYSTSNTGDGCVYSEIEDIAVLGPETQDIFEMLEAETDPRIRALIMADFITGNADTEDREAAIILTQLLLDLIGPLDGTDAEIQAAVDAIHALYYQVKARALQQIFSAETIATILSFGIGNPSYTPQTRAHVIRVISRTTAIARGKGFSSMDAFKRVYGTAGKGKAWHHIVNQRQANITKFGAEKIHNTNNLVKLPHGKGTWHQRITNFYNTINPPGYNTQGLRFGEWVSQKSFQEQFRIGMEIMNMLK